jgi:tetrahydromethanopterin S-methyltransferase subunit E
LAPASHLAIVFLKESVSYSEVTMVYCVKCGAENKEGAEFCANCGVLLHAKGSREKSGDTCFGPESRMEEECFGLPYGGAIVGIVFGVFIIIVGLAVLWGQDIGRWIGPFAAIIIGILIVAGAIYGLRRKPRG